MKQNGWAFEYATEALQHDKEVVLEAVKHDFRVLKYAHTDLKKDKEFILDVLKVNAYAVKYIDKRFKFDPNFIFKAVKSNGAVLKHLSPEMKKRVENRLEEEATIDRRNQLTFDKASKPISPHGWFSDQAPEWEQRLAKEGCSFLSLTDQV